MLFGAPQATDGQGDQGLTSPKAQLLSRRVDSEHDETLDSLTQDAPKQQRSSRSLHAPTRSLNRKRPSTAPPAEAKVPLLPSSSSTDVMSRVPSGHALSTSPSLASVSREAWPSLESTAYEGFSSSSNDGNRSSIVPPSSSLSPPTSLADSTSFPHDITDSYDWNLFVAAYAAGQWDPAQIPMPPCPTQSTIIPPPHSTSVSSQTEIVPRPGILRRAMTSSSSSGTARQLDLSLSRWMRSASFGSSGLNGDSETERPNSVATPSPNTSVKPAPSSESSLSQRRGNVPRLLPEHIPRPHRYSDSIVTDVKGKSPDLYTGKPQRPLSIGPSDSVAVAATLRWASSGVSIRPLALPSPERELTDPIRGAKPIALKGIESSALGRTRAASEAKSRDPRLFSFQEGSRLSGPSRLVPIAGSPDENIQNKKLPRAPATAPILDNAAEARDYFTPINKASTVVSLTGALSFLSRSSSPHASVMSEQARPVRSADATRAEFNRQISEPLPMSPSQVPPLLSPHPIAQFPMLVKPSDNVKHPALEDFYFESRWLPAPPPPDEIERRRALYRFNILYTEKDTNFDRITHLAKLVFQSKGVSISLIDGNEQWFKAEAGIQMERARRSESFCSHSILQRSDEPTVVLDATKDWRFANNPLVIGPPYIRFYAGAALRTSDGYNIGSLCLMDDQPWTEFTPRSRHALKEFSAIIMREMELWRDKIQLRIRERIQVSMESFTRECLQVDSEAQLSGKTSSLFARGAMERIYSRAAELIKKTLDVEGAGVLDVSRSGLHEPSNNSEGQISVTMHGTGVLDTPRAGFLSTEDYSQVVDFFNRHPDGVVTEGRIPAWLGSILPRDILHALIVPVFNIDQRPFSILIAYNTTGVSKNFLDGHELSYLRAIGVIILSAVLKRRMILADKAKSLFISNISHELRTPLHGILAAAELLVDSNLNHHQQSFLQTIQACGASLVETVNHVLDYTKLSGNSRAGGVENMIPPSRANLIQLIEEAVEGCWVGFRARMPDRARNDIGTFYSPPSNVTNIYPVELVVDVDYRTEGWILACEKGGIRRILMNLIGNSLKFTTAGYIQVTLRVVPPLPTTPQDRIRIELGVNDTGKGISADFLRTQIFEPFSQENPLQQGTGLGLAIVKGIVHSKGVDGKLDVSSIEGVGTDMRISFDAEVVAVDAAEDTQDDLTASIGGGILSVELIGFDERHRGNKLLKDTVSTYLTTWWGFTIHKESSTTSDMLLVDEDASILSTLQSKTDFSRPVIILASVRGQSSFMTILDAYERSGGFCRVVFKPGGPLRLRQVLKMCVSMIKMRRTGSRHSSLMSHDGKSQSEITHVSGGVEAALQQYVPPNFPRRRSDDVSIEPLSRPRMSPRSTTFHHAKLWEPPHSEVDAPSSIPPTSPSLTVSIGAGALLLKSSINTIRSSHGPRVLIVEDNDLLRNLLAKWLTSKRYTYREAVDGRQGVEMFDKEGPFDVALIDLSMPVLDGFGATREIRKLEAARRAQRKKGAVVHDDHLPMRILALTGMSALDDKRRAFEAGVDGYLVKPVAFKTLSALFLQLGIL